jgi:hypothetical protein
LPRNGSQAVLALVTLHFLGFFIIKIIIFKEVFMTLFEAINEFIKKIGSIIRIVEKDNKEYFVSFRNYSKEYGRIVIEETNENILDALVNAAKRTGIDDITVTESEKMVFNKVAGMLDDYSPFLFFLISNFEDQVCEFSEYHVAFKVFDDWHGRVYGNLSMTNLEEIILKSVCQTSADLADIDNKGIVAKAADYIRYENGRNPDNDAEVIIRKKDGEYSALIRTNSISHANRTDITPTVEAKEEYPEEAVRSAMKKNNALTNWISKHYLNIKIHEHFACDLIRVKWILDSPENKNTIFRICQNIVDPNDKSIPGPGGFFKVQFKDTSNNKVLAESCSNSIRGAIVDVSRKVIKLQKLPLKIPSPYLH